MRFKKFFACLLGDGQPVGLHQRARVPGDAVERVL
jgi:hypothetical protein